jgi:hypothetical protein
MTVTASNCTACVAIRSNAHSASFVPSGAPRYRRLADAPSFRGMQTIARRMIDTNGHRSSRSDLTSPAGVIVPRYWEEVPYSKKLRAWGSTQSTTVPSCAASALAGIVNFGEPVIRSSRTTHSSIVVTIMCCAQFERRWQPTTVCRRRTSAQRLTAMTVSDARLVTCLGTRRAFGRDR